MSRELGAGVQGLRRQSRDLRAEVDFPDRFSTSLPAAACAAARCHLTTIEHAAEMTLAPAASGKFVARLVGSTVVALDGRVLASWGKDGKLRVPGHEQTVRLRRCSLFERPGNPHSDDGGEYRLDANGTFWLKPPRGKTFSLPAGVTDDVKRDCATALILYWMVPILEDQTPG